MQKLIRWLPATLLLAPAACAFLLDFDELQTADPGDASSGGASGATGGAAGNGGSAATGGTSATGGGAGSGGATGGTGGVPPTDGGDAGPCGGSCDDGDPCTADACVTPDGGMPTCMHAGVLLPDGQLDLPVADYLGGLSVVGAPGRFYISKYVGTKVDGGWEYDTSVFQVPSQAALQVTKEYPLGPTFGGGPRGPVGLVHDGTKLTGFVAVAVQPLLDWRVKQLEFPADLASAPQQTDLCAGACYGFTTEGIERPEPYLGPDGLPAAMWRGPDGIWVGNKQKLPTQKAISAAKVLDLSPVVSNTHVGAFWRDDSALFLTLIGGKQGSPQSCHAPSGVFGGLTSAGRGRLWMGALTTLTAGGPVTEFDSWLVQGSDWIEIANCNISPTSSVVWNLTVPGVAAFKRPPSSPDERVHFAVAAVKASDKALGVSASYVELAPSKAELVGSASFVSSTGVPKLATSYSVDHPIIGYSDDRLLVAWRDSAQAFALQSTLRLQRYKLCQ